MYHFCGNYFLTFTFSLIVYTCIPKQHSLVLPVFKLHMSRIILYIFCYAWSLVLLRYVHADCVCVIDSSLFIFHCWMVFHCINISQYIDLFLLLDIWAVSNLGLLQKIKLWIFLYVYFWAHCHEFLCCLTRWRIWV